MSILNFNGRNIYYDVKGAGKPILILNGIMMSTKSWEPFVNSLSTNNQLIRLENSVYNQDIQVDIIDALLDELKLHLINIVGISYGGEIAIKFACKHPNKIDRLVLFNTTAYTSPWISEIGKSWNNIGKTRNGENYYQATIPVIYSPSFYEAQFEWMKQREALLVPIFSDPKFLDAMERLTNSAEDYDERANLALIKSPTLIVAADEDYLTPLPNQYELHESIRDSELVIIPKAGHASMYEKPMLFVTLVLGFINTLETKFNI